jgi:hypothetical protein
MSDICRLIWCAMAGLVSSRAALQTEILVLRHQLNVLRRKSPKRVAFGNIARLLFVGLMETIVLMMNVALFEGRIDDRLIVRGTTQPLLDAARVFLAEGYDPAARLVMRHRGSTTDALSGRIGELAKLTVSERSDGKAPPKLSRFLGFSRDVISPQGDETNDPLSP